MSLPILQKLGEQNLPSVDRIPQSRIAFVTSGHGFAWSSIYRLRICVFNFTILPIRFIVHLLCLFICLFCYLDGALNLSVQVFAISIVASF